MINSVLTKLYEKSFIDNWELPAVTDYSSNITMTYGDFARKVARIHLLFKQCGIEKGDKIALIGKNVPNWVVVFISAVTYGAVIVPILPDFNPADAQHIINHSDAKLLFSSKVIWDSLDFDELHYIRGAVSVDDFKLLAEKPGETVGKAIYNLTRTFNKTYKEGFYRNDIRFPEIEKDDLVIINYTSGTTGFSKGVMITARNILGNMHYGAASKLHYKGSRCLSFLPLAHAYGCMFDMMLPLVLGSHITLLGRIPSPKILVKAMNDVKPNLVLCVPLVLEKIYSKMIVPMISRGMLRWALAVPFLDNRIYAQIKKKLSDAFGGEFVEVIVGGAAFNAEVEDFLYKIKFPFTVGYGMTECAPLVSHTPWWEYVPHSAGRILPGIMQCRILSDDPENIPGEILLKGENVMAGYYKNPEATAKVLDEDGWMHTGDMGTMSADGTIFIRGRLKTMLLSSSGQNIYPEEIEAKLNNMLFVNESLVIMRNGQLVALVYPDFEAMDQLGVTREQLPEQMERVRAELNKLVAPYERVSKIQLIANEFEKTPKKSIKRYLYDN